MSRAWLARLPEAPAGPDAVAELRSAEGAPAGVLVAWVRESKPVREARRVDRRVIDPDGEAGWLSLSILPRGAWPLFDDPAVQHARRRVLAEPPADLVSTLLADDSHYTGALTLRRGADAPRLLRDEPFARLGGSELLQVGPGLLGRVPAPTGPTIERHGSAQPWPWDRF
ncbi:MAG: hypothetical protein H0V81_15775 [Solirubrobacterales bacterium]|nr:hypothetical protein [Solirubrobacterales bacterium]